MNRKTPQILIGLVVVVVIAVGVYAAKHKSAKTTAPTSTASTSSAIIQTKSNSSLGSYLVNNKGQALYTYGQDSAGVSNCSGSCLANWPAYLATSSTASLPAHVGTIKRPDGSTQYTYDSLPLYTFVGDSQAGSVTGDGSEGFHVAKPVTAAATTQPTPAPSTTTPAPASPAPSSAPSSSY